MNISVVIITRNEGHIIGNTLQSVADITDNIVIVDSGSTDDTLAICRRFGVHIMETSWDGYGNNKNKGIAKARYDWILNLDADEAVDEQLRNQLRQLELKDASEVFEVKFRNFFMGKRIKYGEWGNDKHIRLFNRNKIRWNAAAVHENLTLNSASKITLLQGSILHYTVHSMQEYKNKTIHYARLNARKYFEQGKKTGILKKYTSPLFSFVYNYFIRLGFLDGKEGFIIAKNSARYAYLKYFYLEQLNKKK